MSPILSLRDVHTHFGGLPAVDGVTLDVAPGLIFAIIGPNGAGKSTLLKTISGMHQATSGQVLLEGVDITRMKTHAIRQQGIGKVLQTPRPLPSMTTRENVALGAMFGTPGGRRGQRESVAAADDALDLVGLGPKAGWAVSQLNLHEQRILDLARALAGQPRLLLLDEVMAGLNPAELEASMATVRDVRDNAGVTVVWVEHVMRAVRALADEVAVLNFGQLLAAGTPSEVMTEPTVIEAYLGQGAIAGA
ncbi:MAG TPA: ABC transporter ATP-binding protein [Euzebya sp.]|nr:ABC transporter ATP-binding protein [Euzebya sp.]